MGNRGEGKVKRDREMQGGGKRRELAAEVNSGGGGGEGRAGDTGYRACSLTRKEGRGGGATAGH